MEWASLLLATALLLGLSSSTAGAAEAAPGAGAEDGTTATESTATDPDPETPTDTTTDPAPLPPGDRSDRPWARRWAPERGRMLEVGLFGGVLLPSPRVELFEADVALIDQGHRPLSPAAPDLGVRVGYYSGRWIGVEGEAAIMPARVEPSGRALLWTTRGSVVGQLGLWTVTPFVLVGGGMLGVSSPRRVVGRDVDAAAHVGGGVKIYVSRYTALRLDVRDVITARVGYKAGLSHNPEILLAMTVTLGRPRRPTPRKQPATVEPTAEDHAHDEAASDATSESNEITTTTER